MYRYNFNTTICKLGVCLSNRKADLRGRSDKYLAYKRKTKILESGDLFLNIVSFYLDTLDPAMLQLL